MSSAILLIGAGWKRWSGSEEWGITLSSLLKLRPISRTRSSSLPHCLTVGRLDRDPAARAVYRVHEGSVSVLPLLDAAVPHERPQHQGIGCDRGEQYLNRRIQGTALLATGGCYDVRHAIYRDGDDAETQREEEHKLDLALDAHLAAHDDRDGEEDEEQVRYDVAHSHGQELDIALATLAAGIR